MNFEIFRAYDIRGTYPEEVNEETFYRIARGYGVVVKPKEVVVGMDARKSSPVLKEKVVEGLLDSGIDVIDIGEITTDMIYFTVGAYDYSGGIIVSASHNPAQYNGMKMVREKATAISSDTGLFDIRDALKAGKDKGALPAKKGNYKKRDILDDYVNHVLSFVDTSQIKEFTIVGNANFGYVNKPVQKVVEKLGIKLIPLNFEPDGTFPKGPPDPLLEGNRKETEALVKSSGADLGVAWDADADRVMFFDENGRFISGAYVSALLAGILLKKYGNDNKIIFDPRVLWPTMKIVNELKGQPIVSKSGHTFMKDRMRQEDALFAGEMSAHYYFRDNFYADNGVIPFLLILEHLSVNNLKFSEVMSPFMEGHYMSGELNYKVANVKETMNKVAGHFAGKGHEDRIDGYSLAQDDWRFNVRPSNTEPLLRLNIEAKVPGMVEKLREDIEKLIND